MQTIDSVMKEALSEGVFPGASLLVARGEKILWNQVYGNAQIVPQKRPLLPETNFDIASLTKPLCTATLFMLAVQEKKCALTDLIEGTSLHSLLNHTSGLPDWKPYYKELLQTAPGWVADKKGKEWLIQKILADLKQVKPTQEAIYSDLGYILLGDFLEKIYQKKLDLLFKEKIATPLGLKKTFFNPIERHTELTDSHPDHFAATEECSWRNKILCGEVMDDHAWLMGGVAGHAGLFSTAEDIHRWLTELMNAKNGKGSLIRGETFKLFCTIPKNRDPQIPFFTLGFDTPSSFSSAGKYFSPQSLGHLGYSGTSFWWDLKDDLWVILLTNRVHPRRENNLIREFRPKIHDLIRQEFS